MKKTKLILTVGLLVLVVLGANAQQSGFSGPGGGGQGGVGFTGERQIVTVQQALGFRDDTPVVLQGRIVRALGNEKYTFVDDTGSITIEIDNRLWRNLSVGPNDLVEISGEVDRDRRGVEIEVDRIRKL